MKVLHFSPASNVRSITGRELLSDLNRRSLDSLFADNLVHLSVDATRKPSGWRENLSALAGWLDGLNPDIVRRCLDIIALEEIDVVYIEGSNYGRLARAIRIHAPSCRVITFFHNVESRFFWGALKAKTSIKAIGVLLANWIAEAWAVRFSHSIICLNQRDGDLLSRIYGRNATEIHPLCVNGSVTNVVQPEEPPFGLFVGGAFYANVQGARWLTREVAPKLSCQIVIVGKGFEKYRQELESHPNIKVIGTVDSVATWYDRATFLVAPIFDGSGMKTKVAEALMYGKPVVGTEEAFVGYEAVGERAGIKCQTADRFAEAIGKICNRSIVFDPIELQTLFAMQYSFEAKIRYFDETFSKLVTQDT